MCIICQTSDISTLVRLPRLNCIDCLVLTIIPDILINLAYLNCKDSLLTSIPSTLINLTYLDCRNSHLLTNIPSTFINLTYLDCSRCPILTSIPNTFVNLRHLNCNNCPLLPNIPNTLVNLTCLNCNSCCLLTCIPNTLVKLKILNCCNCHMLINTPQYYKIKYFYHNSSWIDPNKTNNIQKLITLQRFVKKNLKYWIFSRWIKSREFNEWIYHPDNIGGKMAKKQIEKMFE